MKTSRINTAAGIKYKNGSILRANRFFELVVGFTSAMR
jgi:hypothetical protein